MHLFRNDLELPQIEQINSDSGRTYRVPGGHEYPSVTTVLSTGRSEILEKWVERVGQDYADKQKRIGAGRGSVTHDQIEQWLIDGTIPNFKTPSERALFNTGVKALERMHFDPWFTEVPLYSDFLRVAGTIDSGGTVGIDVVRKAIVDFKTSMSDKEDYALDKYKMQTSAYCVMAEERWKISFSHFIIVIMNTLGPPQIVTGKRDDHIQAFIDLRSKFDA